MYETQHSHDIADCQYNTTEGMFWYRCLIEERNPKVDNYWLEYNRSLKVQKCEYTLNRLKVCKNKHVDIKL